MTKNARVDSILQGNFCDVVNFFRDRDLDEVDRLAQRALSILFRTDHLKQTGSEVDTDPFTANMFATIALAAINQTLTTYPFLKPSSEGPEADEQEVFDRALENIETAERLYPDPEILSAFLRVQVSSAVDAFEELFGKYAPVEGLIVVFDGADFDAASMENIVGRPEGYTGTQVAQHELSHDWLGGDRYKFRMGDDPYGE